MKFADLSNEVKKSNSFIVDVENKAHKLKIQLKELTGSAEYLKHKEILRSSISEDMKAQIANRIREDTKLLKMCQPVRANSTKEKAYVWKREGNNFHIRGTGEFADKTIVISDAEMGYKTPLIGNSSGQVGKISEIGLSFQAGKSMVKDILNK